MEVTIVCGPICSGKTTMKRKLEAQGYHAVEIGSLVRKITQTTARIQDPSLDQAIIFELMQLMDGREKVAIIGIRQRSILNAIMGQVPWSNLHIIWLECDSNIAYKRYQNRANVKDNDLNYWEARTRDEKLGLEDLEGYLKTQVSKYIGIDFQIINTDTNETDSIQKEQIG